MKLMIRTLLFVGLAVTMTASVFAQPALYVEGTHYEKIADEGRTSDPNKIEVMEVFWYGCPHCYAFEPLLESWVEKLPSDVNFVRSPGMWNDLMVTHAQIYYTAQALGVIDDTHSVTFDEIHQRRNYLQTEDEIKAFFIRQGVSGDDFDKAWKSFSVSSAVKQANSRMQQYKIRGVPSMVVDGKYLVSTGTAVPSQADMLKVVDFLIQKERDS